MIATHRRQSEEALFTHVCTRFGLGVVKAMYARSHPDQDAACLDGRSWCGAHFQNMDLLHFLNIAIVFFQGHMQEEFHKTFTRVQLKNR